MKNTVIVLLFCTFFSQTHAERIAVKICSSNDWTILSENNIKVISHLKEFGYVFIETDINDNVLSNFCYYSTVKQHEDKFSFNTNTLLVKTSKDLSEEEQLTFNLKKHKYIPQLYTLETIAQNGTALNNLINSLKLQNWIERVQTNQVFTLQSTSNDPIYGRQWSIENTGSVQQYSGTPGADMSVDSAWTLTQGSSTVKIAILDSGVDTLHEDLINNLQTGYDAFSTDTTDTKGFPTPNFSNDGHGTACAGIAAATVDNNKGVAGIAPNCQLVPIRIFFYRDYGSGIGVQPTTSTLGLLNGSAYAWRNADADIMSTSAGLSNLFIAVLNIDVAIINAEIVEAFVNGRNGFGVPMFFSAGNDDINDVLWPGDLPTTIAVGASTMCDERKNPTDCSNETWGSSFGTTLDIVAPGVKIASTDMTGTNGYETANYTNTFNGTSAACPNAAGVGALILSMNDSLHARDVKAILNSTADRVGGYNYDSTTVHGTWNEEMGHGRINAFAAVKLAQTYETTVSITKIVESTLDFLVYPNPSNGFVTFINSRDETLRIHIVDLLGKTIDIIDLKANSNINYLFKAKGYYFLKDAKKASFVKVVIQ